MGLNIAASLCLLSLGVVIVGSGLRLVDRLDRLQLEHNKQNACRWHHWKILEEGSSLVCAACGKKHQMINTDHDRDPEPGPFDHHFP